MKKHIGLFKSHKEQNEVHLTSDGYYFFEKHKADSHASSLKDREVKTITREQAEAEEAEDKKAEEANSSTEAEKGKGKGKGKGGAADAGTGNEAETK